MKQTNTIPRYAIQKASQLSKARRDTRFIILECGGYEVVRSEELHQFAGCQIVAVYDNGEQLA